MCLPQNGSHQQNKKEGWVGGGALRSGTHDPSHTLPCTGHREQFLSQPSPPLSCFPGIRID